MKKIVKDAELCPVTPLKILEDNVDVMVSPANMTVERHRKSWHWFRILATQKRVTDLSLPSCNRQNDILKLNPVTWLPNCSEIQDYMQKCRI